MRISLRKVVYGAKCKIPGCIGHHCIHPGSDSLTLPPAFTYLLKPEEEKADRLGKAIAYEVYKCKFSSSSYDDILRSIMPGSDAESTLIARLGIRSRISDNVPGYLDAAMATKRS